MRLTDFNISEYVLIFISVIGIIAMIYYKTDWFNFYYGIAAGVFYNLILDVIRQANERYKS